MTVSSQPRTRVADVECPPEHGRKAFYLERLRTASELTSAFTVPLAVTCEPISMDVTWPVSPREHRELLRYGRPARLTHDSPVLVEAVHRLLECGQRRRLTRPWVRSSVALSGAAGYCSEAGINGTVPSGQAPPASLARTLAELAWRPYSGWYARVHGLKPQPGRFGSLIAVDNIDLDYVGRGWVDGATAHVEIRHRASVDRWAATVDLTAPYPHLRDAGPVDPVALRRALRALAETNVSQDGVPTEFEFFCDNHLIYLTQVRPLNLLRGRVALGLTRRDVRLWDLRTVPRRRPAISRAINRVSALHHPDRWLLVHDSSEDRCDALALLRVLERMGVSGRSVQVLLARPDASLPSHRVTAAGEHPMIGAARTVDASDLPAVGWGETRWQLIVGALCGYHPAAGSPREV